MSSLTDRLRDVIRATVVPPGDGPSRLLRQDAGEARHGADGAEAAAPPAICAAEVLGGEWRETGGQRFLVVDRRYSAGYRHGQVAVADSLPPDSGAWPSLSLLAAGAACSGRLLFVDLETTGLAGGAGSYAFLVGCGWFEPPSSSKHGGAAFRVRQFFLASFAAERLLLEAVTEAAEASGTVVTYNGKSFDLPLLDTRFVMNRMETPFAGMPHVDMLHPARRLWRSDEDGEAGTGPVARAGGLSLRSSGCRLTALEETLCGHRREDDVPGFEIPSRYFHYVRSGDARGLQAVLEHNRLDLLALAMLTARASQLLEDGPAAAATAREALGMARLYARAGRHGEARAAFARAAEMPGAEVATRAEALRECALLLRRERRYADAASAWRRIIELRRCPAHLIREATEALAVHHEHRLRDPFAARTFALESMKLHQSASRREALAHRLARLDRKLGGRERAAPLFTAI